MMKRYLENQISSDIEEKMVFIGGPRQVGKTYVAKQFIKNELQYLNWDRLADKRLILSDKINTDHKLLVLDEIHKYRHWRGLVKGLFAWALSLFTTSSYFIKRNHDKSEAE